ncbi:molecular chaperone Hsp70 [Rhizophagus irregularis DAOM 181602=DAOM 197198]|nr:molecular chaperone Hsp70 [Rhizophagus irregularis DAOM 181602=DAOM 197198]
MIEYAVGIDLGTSYSCVSVWHNDRAEIIANDYGYRITPSYVAFTNSEILIGDAAKNQISLNPHNTVFDICRLIGRSFHNLEAQSVMKYWPFTVIEKNEKPYIRVTYKGEKKDFTPEEIVSMLLVKMKETAEYYLGGEVRNVVITVPTYFNISQYQAIKDAGLIADLDIIRIVNSPTTAAITYGLNTKTNKERNVLVFDLGGGTCSVSILTIDDEIFEVKAVAGNNHLGGEDFDDRLINHFVQEFRKKFNKDLTSDKRALCRLRNNCEYAKRSLSASISVNIEIDCLLDYIDFYISLTRGEFEELNQDLFQSAMKPIEKVLRDAKIEKYQVHEICLVGGSSRIPKIQKMISNYFNGKELKLINPDEASARGAAVQAAILSSDTFEKVRNILLLDVTSLSLGIETSGSVITPIIKQSLYIDTNPENKSSVLIQVYEGERSKIGNNKLLGKFELTISSVPQIEVTFKLDLNYILKVSAVDKSMGKSHKKKIIITIGLSKEEIKFMVAEAKKYRAEKEKIVQKMQARNDFESYTYILCNLVRCVDNMDKVYDAIQESITWFNNNEEAEKDEYEHKQKLLKEIVIENRLAKNYRCTVSHEYY